MHYTRFASLLLFQSFLLFPVVTLGFDLSKIDVSPWSAYSTHIRNCTPGTFDVPDIVSMAFIQLGSSQLNNNPTEQKNNQVSDKQLNELVQKARIHYQILGMENNKCHVNGEYASGIEMVCMFSTDTLPLLATNAAQIASGSYSASSNSPISKAMQSSCALRSNAKNNPS